MEEKPHCSFLQQRVDVGARRCFVHQRRNPKDSEDRKVRHYVVNANKDGEWLEDPNFVGFIDPKNFPWNAEDGEGFNQLASHDTFGPIALTVFYEQSRETE